MTMTNTTRTSTPAPFPSIAQLGAALRSGQSTSLALVEECLQRIAQFDTALHCFIGVYAEEARAAARTADAELAAGLDRGPLHGIPTALKDLVDLAGKPTTAGSPLLQGNRARHDAELVERLRRAGAVVVGKTHLVQFALGAWGTNPHMGTPVNPHGSADMPLAPGGSSSGSAAAVAAHLVPWAIGTDTGGSVRVPAAFCGIVGFKPTIDALPRGGVYGLSQSLDSVGILAASTADAQACFRALAGTTGAAPGPLAPQRIGFLPAADLAGTAPALLADYARCLARLRTAGHALHAFRYPVAIADFKPPTNAIMVAEGAAANHALLDDPGAPIDPAVRPRLLAARATTAVEYLQAQALARQWQAQFTAGMDARGLDVLLTPTTQDTAPPLADIDHNVAPVHFTRPVNLLGLCGLSLPTGADAQRRPIGLQLVGRAHDDQRLLQAGLAIEELCPSPFPMLP